MSTVASRRNASVRVFFDLASAVMATVLLAGLCACGDRPGTELPKLVWDSTSIVFQPLGAGEYDLRRVTLGNAGEAPVYLTSIDIRGGDGDFSIVEGPADLPVRIRADEYVEVVVRYAPATVADPSDADEAVAHLVIESNDPDTHGHVAIPIHVLGSGGVLFVTPRPVDFGRVVVDESATRDVRLQNIGNTPLEVIDVWVVGGNDRFQILDETLREVPFSLGRDEHEELQLRFTATSEGPVEGALVMRLGDGVLVDASLVANTDSPCLAVDPSVQYDFGQVAAEHAAEQSFTVRNCADPDRGEILEVSAIELVDDASFEGSPDFALDHLPELPLSLQPDESEAFVVRFAPSEIDIAREGLLRVTSDDPYQPVAEVLLNGIGTDSPPPAAIARCRPQGTDLSFSNEVLVEPLMVLECSGAASTGDIVSYEWRIVSMPPGTTRFEPSDEVLSTILIPTIGTYVLELVVWDSSGRRSDPGGDAVVRVVAEADDHIRVELTWETPTDPDPSDIGAGKGADVDLHFLHPAGCWSDDLWDCHFRSPRPDWGVPGTDRDDPDLDWDDTDGGGPEIVTFENPQDGNTYRIGVHYYNDHGFGTSFATVRVYLFGELVFATVDKELRAQDAWWVVAEIDWPSGEVTEIDDVSIGGVPMCSWAP